ncbi:hypothetical protein HMPREF1635_02740 [Clostridiales bacterium S5-A14a]|nr:hypothetical protein HMPREF1635_02740 [Clostridiales bacterium S5-A14a]
MYYSLSIMLLVITSIFAMFAQFKVKNAFSTYRNVNIKNQITGAMAAKMVLEANGISDVTINQIPGSLSDHYDPRSKVISLSQDVYAGTSISAVSVATHEVGHAIQHHQSFPLLTFRNAFVPLVNLASRAVWPLTFLAIILMYNFQSELGSQLLSIAAIAMVVVLLFHLITLPVEIDASRRALKQLEVSGIMQNEELAGAKRVLSAAAMTYIAALAVSVANLVRILAMRNDR